MDVIVPQMDIKLEELKKHGFKIELEENYTNLLGDDRTRRGATVKYGFSHIPVLLTEDEKCIGTILWRGFAPCYTLKRIYEVIPDVKMIDECTGYFEASIYEEEKINPETGEMYEQYYQEYIDKTKKYIFQHAHKPTIIDYLKRKIERYKYRSNYWFCIKFKRIFKKHTKPVNATTDDLPF